ncbi:hypothetical protein ACFFWD_09845 [Bradyrhizobium erythrophlei]|uniref:hypothetical protein n=1 Tax=Bradyrhizobium erythrophlei TaxID=1437360 RepID=UPI0035E5A167
MEKGKISRLATFPAVKKGQWYYGFNCKGCKEPIYLLTFEGIPPSNLFVGEGQFSVPCPLCQTDVLYETHEFIPLKARRDIPSPHQSTKRIEPSNMARQPLKRKYPKVKPTFGPGHLEDRPAAAALVARCVSLWTDIEVQQAHLLAKILHANTEPAIAMFLAISNSRTQFDVLNAAARVVLNELDYELFGALMNIRNGLEKERNHLVHGVYGAAQEIKEGVLWVNPIDQAAHTVRVSASGVTPEALEAFRDKIFVYEPGDLETIARDFEAFHRNLGFFIGYLHSPEPTWRAERYPQLCAWPPLQRELTRLREGQKNKH